MAGNRKNPSVYSRINRVIEDETLPYDPTAPTVRQVEEGEEHVPQEPLLTVQDILGPNSPYRQTDPVTGEDVINTKGLHISHMDMEDVRRQVNARIRIGQRLHKRLEDLGDQAEAEAGRAGPDAITICVDTKKNINLRAAIRRLYGRKTNCITFKMYKQAVHLRSTVSRQDVNDILEDFTMGDSQCKK